MKRTRRIKEVLRHRQPVVKQVLIYDEFHTMLATSTMRSHVVEVERKWRRPGAGVLVTQAILRANSGKRVRFLGSARRADGSPLGPAPKRFVPVQVKRRLARELLVSVNSRIHMRVVITDIHRDAFNKQAALTRPGTTPSPSQQPLPLGAGFQWMPKT
jgi:hypothetical protein